MGLFHQNSNEHHQGQTQINCKRGQKAYELPKSIARRSKCNVGGIVYMSKS
jgi:hypothetical protein